MFVSDQCMYWCTSLCEFVVYSVLQLSQSSPQSLQTLISLHTDLRTVPGVSRAAQGRVNLQQERGEILQHGECYGVIYCIIIDQRDHVDWPVGGGGDPQCVTQGPINFFKKKVLNIYVYYSSLICFYLWLNLQIMYIALCALMLTWAQSCCDWLVI